MTNVPARRFDEKLSRGLVRQEARALDRDVAAFGSQLYKVIYPALEKIAKGQKITDREMGAMDANFRALLADKERYLDGSAIRNLRALRAKDHFISVRVVNVMPDPENNEFALGASRFFVEPRRIIIAAVLTPFSFSQHVAERILQRRRSEITAKPVMGVGQAMASSTGLLAFAIRMASAFPERRLAIPYEEGLILGEIGETDSLDMIDVSELTSEGEQPVPFTVSVAFVPSTPKGHFIRGRTLTFSGRTFIGQDEMYPVQKELHAAWTEFAGKHAHAIDVMARHALWPGLSTREVMEMWKHDASEEVQIIAACRDAERILSNPDFARAMGNSSPPVDPPLNFLEAGIRNRKLEMALFDDEDELAIDTGSRR